ncbi:CGNR zinc finger domain-containing protein [Curtobacterium sp. NPDC092190]|uniref:CGNR zinc finger domain-containing protein n=1 Tax=Curtobacterium sp. NPDC092190 TaxID=3363973 RepID=UPI0038247D35
MDAPAKPAFPKVAGHLALDLVDTVHWRLDDARSIDTLPTFDELLRWSTEIAGCADLGDLRAAAAEVPDVAARELAAVVRLREAIYEAVFQGSDTAVDLVASEYAGAVQRSSLVRDPDRSSWSWSVPTGLTGPRTLIARQAQDLLTSDLSRARQCGDDACGWVYLDTSPRHNRIWCTAAGCGNRNRVARHQARKQH